MPPPPYCYHPELFPELAKNNPAPTNYPIYKKPPNPKNQVKFAGKAVETPLPNTRIKIPESFLQNKGNDTPVDNTPVIKEYLDRIREKIAPQTQQQSQEPQEVEIKSNTCLLYTSPSPRDS
eukprot:TRINITY_DN2187_c0_g2_i3.p1 TRINITY_DN2187_c0_g2~~TRINITY_DN2187_c0_g2_i3.p1  ORF type:complete len:121 (-),score=28.37 TRINITY_DN2187_c0_g2_i3:41-403(-)